MATLFMSLFWGLDSPPVWLATMILMAAGFCIYGPQALVGIAAANMATKRAAATAGGFTGLFGYGSGLLSGVGLGLVAQKYGWGYGVASLIGIGVLGAIAFIFAWPAKAHGYETDETEDIKYEVG
jgi:OPA family glycerol-3-phosphate transporter-like MFS transporter/OPA family sugar phosphate sensor protein UhpC-like MFS transporter